MTYLILIQTGRSGKWKVLLVSHWLLYPRAYWQGCYGQYEVRENRSFFQGHRKVREFCFNSEKCYKVNIISKNIYEGVDFCASSPALLPKDLSWMIMTNENVQVVMFILFEGEEFSSMTVNIKGYYSITQKFVFKWHTSLYNIINSTTWKYCSVAFIWMVTL